MHKALQDISKYHVYNVVDLVMEVENVGQLTHAESDKDRMGETDFCMGIELSTSAWYTSTDHQAMTVRQTSASPFPLITAQVVLLPEVLHLVDYPNLLRQNRIRSQPVTRLHEESSHAETFMM